jgi:hypothetical protein
MNAQRADRRTAWHRLSRQDKHQRLQDLRRRQQRQVEFEMLRLQHHVR